MERYLSLVRLDGLGERRTNELSGGQQQRVAIAWALVFEPDLLLLGEPLAELGRKMWKEMQLEFRRIQRELGVTTINGTHDQREAVTIHDEVIGMDKGRIQQMDPPEMAYRAVTFGRVDTTMGRTITDVIFEGDRIVYEVRVEAFDGAVLRVFDRDPILHIGFDIGSPVFLG